MGGGGSGRGARPPGPAHPVPGPFMKERISTSHSLRCSVEGRSWKPVAPPPTPAEGRVRGGHGDAARFGNSHSTPSAAQQLFIEAEGATFLLRTDEARILPRAPSAASPLAVSGPPCPAQFLRSSELPPSRLTMGTTRTAVAVSSVLPPPPLPSAVVLLLEGLRRELEEPRGSQRNKQKQAQAAPLAGRRRWRAEPRPAVLANRFGRLQSLLPC